MKSTITVELDTLARTINIGIVLILILFGVLGYFVSFYSNFLTVAFFLLVLLNIYCRHIP